MRCPSHWRPGREGTPPRERRGAAYLSAEGGASAALPPPPTFWQGLGPFRPASALLGSRPPPPLALSLPLSLPPSLWPGTAPELQRASLPWLVVRVLSALAHLDNSPPPPRALSHLNFSENLGRAARCPPPSHSCSRGRRQAAAGVGTRGERGAPAGPSGNMATGGYRSGGSTTDFLEEWKAKREKMRAKQNPAGPGSGGGGDPAAKSPAGPLSPTAAAGTSELNHGPAGAAAPAVPGPTALNCALGPSALPRSAPGSRRPEEECSTAAAVAGAPASRGDEEEPDGSPEKGRSSGPSARKGKGQIEKRKLREKRRSTGVVNIPAAECLDEYEDDEAGQKERKREDAITQQNTIQNEAASLLDPGTSYLSQDPSRTVPGRYKSTSTAPEDDASSRYPRTDRGGFNRHNRDANMAGNFASSSTLEKRIEDLEKEVARERQENLRLVRLMQDKEEMIGKLKEEIDLLNRDLDDIEDENEQLKQENKTLLKVVGQLTR